MSSGVGDLGGADRSSAAHEVARVRVDRAIVQGRVSDALVDALEAGDVQLAIDITRESVAAARRRLEAEIQS